MVHDKPQSADPDSGYRAAAEPEWNCAAPDSAANPYLTLAGGSGSGLDGIRRQIDPPAAVTENIFEMRLSQIIEAGNRITSGGSGRSGRSILRRILTFGKCLANTSARSTARQRWQMWADYRAQVTGWEIGQLPFIKYRAWMQRG